MAKKTTKSPTKAAKKGYAKAGKTKATPRPRRPPSPVTKTPPAAAVEPVAVVPVAPSSEPAAVPATTEPTTSGA